MTVHELVFFDIDGTLLNDQNQIPESTRQAVRMLQENGVHTAIATGRNPSSFEWVREELNINSYVSINGQYVVYEGKMIYENPMAIDSLEQISQFADEAGHAIAYFNHAEIAVTQEAHPVITAGFSSINLPYPNVDKAFFRHSPVYQGNLFVTVDEQAHYEKQFPHFRFVRWHEHVVDILPLGSSKAVGIHHLLKAIGVENRKCIAFGDGLNDIEMLTTIGTGIAMGNAVPEAKRAADLVTTSSSEDGIWNGLKQLGYPL
ncbi:Cof-type HAD-IIB family hydrolase [Paenibacillus sp. GCM10027626]|uniref:Cof-type HAD-IIB family hydrolase n=1 Tax=Paenibacillus sp. GCM10027626 TaxID=3273411 RepID=UPI00362EC046